MKKSNYNDVVEISDESSAGSDSDFDDDDDPDKIEVPGKSSFFRGKKCCSFGTKVP